MKRALVTLCVILAATAAAVATPSVDRVKAANYRVIPASEWRDTVKVTAPKFLGRQFVKGVGKVALYKDDCGVYYHLRSEAGIELRKYIRPSLMATKVSK